MINSILTRDTEDRVLGAILLDNSVMSDVAELLTENCFSHQVNRSIFASMLLLYEKNRPVDVETVADDLQKANKLEMIGGKLHLLTLMENLGTASNAGHHAEIVLDRAILRDLIAACSSVVEKGKDGFVETRELLDTAEQQIFDISQKRIKGGFVRISKIVSNSFESIDKFRDKNKRGLPTGFLDLDDILVGLQKPNLVIIAGRPSMGKTALVLSLIEYWAVKKKIPIGLFSLEMSQSQVGDRLLCSCAKVSSHKMRAGKLNEEELTKLSISAGNLTDAPIFVDDTPSLSLLEMRAKSRRLKTKEDIQVLVVDYLQLMQLSRRVESRQQEISIISSGLKALAKDLDIPIVACSQLSRAVEMRGGKRRPQLADLRESGSIEQDADEVLFIYRPEMYGLKSFTWRGETVSSEGIAEIVVAKHRNGPTGRVLLTFLKNYSKFVSRAVEL